MNEADEMGLTPEAAQGYEDLFVPAIFAQWPPVILNISGLGEGQRLLEVGCGTGVLAREADRIVGPNGSVTGLDLSESMLGVARQTCPNALFHQGNAMDLPFANESFDVAIASFVLMFVPDQALAIREMWRVIKPGGRLVVSVWESLADNPAYAELVDVAISKIDEEAGASLAWPFALGEAGKLEGLFSLADIDDVAVEAFSGRAKFASLEQFVRTEIQAWVLADSVTDTAINAVLDASQARLAQFCDQTGALDIPFNARIALAMKPST